MDKKEPQTATICSNCEQDLFDQCEKCHLWGCCECEFPRDVTCKDPVICYECRRKVK